MSNSLWPHELYSPWNSPGQNTGVGSLSLLQGIFPNQGLNPDLLHCRWILYQLSYKDTGVDSLSLLQGIVPTQESNWGLLHCRQILYQLSYQGNPGKGTTEKLTSCCLWNLNCASTLEEALKGKLDVGAGAVRESGLGSGWSFYEVTFHPRGKENAPVGGGTGGAARRSVPMWETAFSSLSLLKAGSGRGLFSGLELIPDDSN